MSYAFFGALSFEPRALHGLSTFLGEVPNAASAQVVLLDYGSSATSSAEATRLRAATLQMATAMCAEVGCELQIRSCSAYSARAFWGLLREKLTGSIDLTVDVSCMTRPHVLALASWLSKRMQAPWNCHYTIPESYGNLDHPRATGGWRDTLNLSLGRGTELGPERNAVGLFLCGHESARAALAFDELEPSLGMILVARSSLRPDFYRVALANNLDISTRLLTLQYQSKASTSVVEKLGSDGWEIEPVDVTHPLSGIAEAAQRCASAAKACEPAGSVVLYPFGPKHAVFAAALSLAYLYGESSWSIVPIHRSHGVDYSAGVLGHVQFSSAEVRSALSGRLLDG